MNLILSGRDIGTSDLKRTGGKALALAALARAGFTIPNFFYRQELGLDPGRSAMAVVV